MKTILLSLALGALIFVLVLGTVKTRAAAVSPSLIPEAGADLLVEPVEVDVVSRADPRLWKKPVSKPIVQVRREVDHSFSRYRSLGLRAVPVKPAPARID